MDLKCVERYNNYLTAYYMKARRLIFYNSLMLGVLSKNTAKIRRISINLPSLGLVWSDVHNSPRIFRFGYCFTWLSNYHLETYQLA